MAKECINCPAPDWDGYERFRWLDLVFDVKRARQIVAASEHEQFKVSPDSLRKIGVPLDPEEDWKVREDGTRYKTIHMGTGINESHLAHIPDDKLE